MKTNSLAYICLGTTIIILVVFNVPDLIVSPGSFQAIISTGLLPDRAFFRRCGAYGMRRAARYRVFARADVRELLGTST
jgi:hypothetical protein